MISQVFEAIAVDSLLFIDPKVEDYQTLVSGTKPNIKLVLLDTYRDGIDQITESLVRNPGVKTVHILSHGAQGCLYIGKGELSWDNLQDYAPRLQQWGQILGDNAQILIYGCNVGADLAFVRRLGELTGANIAASATPTGNASLGGNWELEVRTGQVSTPLAFEPAAMKAYNGLLDRLFAVKDDGSDLIVELNPSTGAEINSFSTPEPLITPGPQGLAFDGNSLFFVNDNGELWELDPDTGAVRDNDPISVSGGFAGLAVLGGNVYISDYQNRDIIEFDPVSDSITSTLDIDGINGGAPFFVGLAGITGPNALLVSDANSSELLEINPITGVITNSFLIPNSGDGVAVVDNEIYVTDYDGLSSSAIEVFDRTGTSQRTINLNYPVWALGGDDVGSSQVEEPNDTLTRATHTGLTIRNDGTFSYSGEIGDNTYLLPDYDVDFFKFDLGLGDTVRLPSAGLELFDENGNFIALAEGQMLDSTGMQVPLFPADDPDYVIYEAEEAGTFYVGIAGSGNWNYDPNEQGSGSSGTPGYYNLTIETIGREMGTGSGGDRLFAVKDDGSDLIVELNPSTGAEINSFSTPEPLITPGPQGLAFDGNSLFFVNDNGNSTELWELDPDTGAVRDNDPITGTGGYEGLAALGGKVYILNGVVSDILEFDPISDTVTNTLDINGINNGVWVYGGLAGITEPNALLVSDANSSELLEINPITGVITNSFPIPNYGDGVAVIDNEIYVSNYDGLSSSTIEVFDRAGTPQRTINLDGPVWALGGDDIGSSQFEEPNDTLVRATSTGLTIGNDGIFSYSGEIGDNTYLLPGYDVDFFKFDLGLGEKVRLPATIELFDESGNPIFADAEAQLLDSTGMQVPLDLDPDDPNFVVYETDEAGTFYVGISGSGNTNYDPNEQGTGFGGIPGNYNLTIETIGREMGGYETGKLYFSRDAVIDGQGLYSLDTTTGAATFIGISDSIGANVGLAPSDSSSILYGSEPYSLLTIDADGSGANSVGMANQYLNGLAYDAASNILYGVDGGDFFTVNPNTGDRIVTLTTPFTSLQGLAFGNDGVYGLGSSQDLLFYDPDTDNWSYVGDTGESWWDAGLAFDADKNVLYAKRSGDSSLYEIDLSTAQPTVIGDTGITEGGGLAIVSDRVYEEPNDTLVRAISTGLTLTNPGTFAYSGEIGDNTNLLPEDDVDLFKFDLDAGETVRLPETIELLDDDGNAIGATAELKMFDVTGTSISLAPDGPDHVIYQPLQTGTFYVGVSGNGNTSYDPNTEGSGFGSAAGNYNLTIETTSSRTGDEPNDTLTDATDTGLTLTNPGTFSYSGEIGDNTNILEDEDVDFYKFDLDIGEEVSFTLPELFDENSNPIGPATLRLFDSNGFDIGWTNDPNDPNQGTFFTLEAGTFYLGISGDGNSSYDPNIEGSGSGWNIGTYDLTIQTIGRTMGTGETNDTLTDATDTGLTLTNSGTFSYSGEIGDNTNLLPEDDVDFFKFDLDIGEEVSFNLPEFFDENNNPMGMATVRLFDSNGFDIGWTNDPNDFNKGTFSTPEAGTFYLGISSDGNYGYDPNIEGSGYGWNIGTYDLTIQTIDRPMGDDEPNDTLTYATDTGLTLTNPGTYAFSGEIGDNANILPDEDVDFFKFDLDLGEEASFNLPELFDENNNPMGMATVRLFDSTGFDIGWTNDPNDFNKGTFSTPEAGTFYLGISSDGNYSYDSNIEGSGSGWNIGTYDLTIETVGRTMGDDEPNDTLTDATDTGLTLTNPGTFSYSGEIGDNANLLQDEDVDFFKFDLDIGEEASFNLPELLDENSNPIGPATVRLFDSTGTDIGWSNDPNDPNKGTFSTPAADTFYLGISGDGNSSYDPNIEGSGSGFNAGTYDLTIETTDSSSNQAQPFDFNTDGVADILWRNTTDGNNQIWLMNNDGSRNSIAYPGYRDTNWQAVEVADFSNDGVADILWRNSSNGNNEIWLMNNDGTRNTIAYPGARNTNWQVVEVANFSNDSVPDILWRNTSNGKNQIWLMNADGTRNSIANPGTRNTNWQVVEVANFSSDDVADILWRNSSNGNNEIWLMNNDGTRNTIAYPGARDANWEVAEAANFSSDDVADILWRNSSNGNNEIWLMNNDGSRNTIAYPGARDTSWEVADTADFNGDNVDDILWRNTTDGDNQIWLINSDGSRNNIAYPGYRSTDWNLAEVADYSNDGVSDLLWRNGTNGSNEIWLMNSDGSRNTIAYPGTRDTAWEVISDDFNAI